MNPRFRYFLPGMTALAVSLTACGEDEKSFFPLDEGWNWEYRVTTESKAGEGLVKVSTYFVTNLAPVEMDGRSAVPRLRADGGMEFYADTPEGVLWLGEKPPGKEFVAAPERILVIGNPGAPASGWEVKDRVRLLRRRLAFNRSYLVEVPITIRYGQSREAVSVPAGDFENCLKVSGEGRGQYDGGYDLGIVDIRIETSDWYAPGVGLVKSVRRENSSNFSISYGEYVMELESFSRGS